MEQLESDGNIRVIILTGSGKAFKVGGDLYYLEQLKTPLEINKFISKAGYLIHLINTMEKPIIAMVNGIAAGAGFNLALACGIIYCSKSAEFIQSFSKAGLVPDCGGFCFLPRVVGLHKAKELMFIADTIDVETAYKIGIVNYVVEDSSLKIETYKYAKRLETSAPVAIGLIKKGINKTYEFDLKTITEMEANFQTLCIQTDDFREGVDSFKGKRNPKFKGF